MMKMNLYLFSKNSINIEAARINNITMTINYKFI